MASYTYTQLYGSGSIGETISSGVEKVFTFTNPGGSSYFTMETIPSSSGFYEAASPKNFSGSFENDSHPYENPSNPTSMNPWGLVTSSYIASVVVPPGNSTFLFFPAITVTGTTYRLRGTGGYSLNIASGGVSAPVNTVAPVASGGTYIGNVLTTTNGTWTGSPTFTYQWYNILTGNPIVGATNNTYTLLEADANTEINCQVTGTNVAGSGQGSSNIINTTALFAPVNISLPFINDGITYYKDSELSFTGNVWDGNPVPTLTYQWLRGGNNIAGATNVTYTAVTADIDYNISVKCIATNSQGTDFVTSNEVFIYP